MKLDEQQLKRRSKLLSAVLRHQPELIGLHLDSQGWASVEELLQKINKLGPPFTKSFDLETLKLVVETNDKKRFAFNADQTRIRASQGHSVQVDLGYPPQEPPELLYHGTAGINLESIKDQGITKGKRHHVHLSRDTETALKVGGRHGKPVILKIQAGAMHRAGNAFYCSENGVWLTEFVPAAFIEF